MLLEIGLEVLFHKTNPCVFKQSFCMLLGSMKDIRADEMLSRL